MRRPVYALFLLGALSMAGLAQAAGESCSSSSKCPESSPCCGQGNTCGSGALQCADSCQPLASFSAASCSPNPICTDKNITFAPSDYNNADVFRPILLYNGDASKAPFTLDYGFLGKGPEGVLLQLTAPTQTKISTTDFMLYGSVSLTARYQALQGVVFAFITMSDTKDEIDWEFTTADGSQGYTNYFSQGVVAPGTSATVSGRSGFSVADWHTYGINWQEDSLEWSIDGRVVHSVTRSAAGNNYPRSPSRIQVSTWAGGNSTNAPGVIEWAGGAVDWASAEYTSQGYYSAEIKSFAMTCASQNVDGVDKVGTGPNVTSWVYSGQNTSAVNGPEFSLSTDPIKFVDDPSQDGRANVPGFETQSDFTVENSNSWDGSGDTSGLSASEIGGASSNSGGWLANNKTLSIAVPIAAAAVAIIALWATAVWCVKKRRKSSEISYGSKENDASVPGVMAAVVPSTNRKASPYNKLENASEEDVAPAGTKRMGAGYGPAVGPSPGRRQVEQGYSDSSSSEASYPMDERARSAASHQYPAQGMRGPYTPAFNAYTPAVRQTPMLNNWNAPARQPPTNSWETPAMQPAANSWETPRHGYGTPAYDYPQRVPTPQTQYVPSFAQSQPQQYSQHPHQYTQQPPPQQTHHPQQYTQQQYPRQHPSQHQAPHYDY